jgi:hypothetical protein
MQGHPIDNVPDGERSAEARRSSGVTPHGSMKAESESEKILNPGVPAALCCGPIEAINSPQAPGGHAPTPRSYVATSLRQDFPGFSPNWRYPVPRSYAAASLKLHPGWAVDDVAAGCYPQQSAAASLKSRHASRAIRRDAPSSAELSQASLKRWLDRRETTPVCVMRSVEIRLH